MNEIINSIYSNPEDWHMGAYQFVHKDGIMIWANLGFLGLELNNALKISFMERIRLWRAIRWWGKNAPTRTTDRDFPIESPRPLNFAAIERQNIYES